MSSRWKNVQGHFSGSPYGILTSTCIQTLYFLQMSATANRGSNAPYTVVPAVALTRKGTNPCANERAPNIVKWAGGQRILLKSWLKKDSGHSPPIIHVCIFGTIRRVNNTLEPGRNDVRFPGSRSSRPFCWPCQLPYENRLLVLRRGYTGLRGE